MAELDADDLHFPGKLFSFSDADLEELSARFAELGIEHVPSTTNFLFTNLGPRAGAVNESLLSRGIVIRPMTAPGIESWARISLGTRAGNERLVAALAEALG